jgi:hypothetical protein
MAHQNWTQASERFRGALQNVGIEMILKAGRMDAEYSARIMGSVNPMEVKHVVEDEQAEERSHPAYSSLGLGQARCGVPGPLADGSFRARCR